MEEAAGGLEKRQKFVKILRVSNPSPTPDPADRFLLLFSHAFGYFLAI